MIRSIFQSGFSSEAIVQILLLLPIIMISLSVHELSHGYVAHLCGDDTAKVQGRLTLNPLKHFDPIGTLMMLLVGFGWAKPVPIVTRNFKKFKRDLALVSLAGPVSNFLLAFIGSFLLFLSGRIMGADLRVVGGNIFHLQPINKLETLILTFFLEFIIINIGFALFNLIPLPPLDGSRILSVILPPKMAYSYIQLEQYSRFIFLGILLSSYIPFKIGSFSSLSDLIYFPIQWSRNAIMELFLKLFDLIL